MFQALLQTEAGQVVGADRVAQEGGELLVLLDPGVLPGGAEEAMPGFDPFQGGMEFPRSLVGDKAAEDLRDLVGGQPPPAHLAPALEDPGEGEVTPEDEMAAVRDRVDRVEAAQIHGPALARGELRAPDQRPALPSGADDLRAEPVCGGLPGGRIVGGQEGVVVFPESDPDPIPLSLDD
jgi:hypothetical protein